MAQNNEILLNAIKLNDLETVKILLEHGADIESRDIYGNTTLHLAMENCSVFGYTPTVKLLIELNVDIDAQNQFGETILHMAASSSAGVEELVHLLLELGARTDIRNMDGATAADVAKTDKLHDLILRSHHQKSSTSGRVNPDAEKGYNRRIAVQNTEQKVFGVSKPPHPRNPQRITPPF